MFPTISREDDYAYYENSDPDKYATSVYSAPHWMISRENPNKRRKLQASNVPQELVKPLEMTDLPLPGYRELNAELPQLDLERQIKRKVSTNLERKIKNKLITKGRNESKLAVVSSKAANKSLDQQIKMRLAEEEKCRSKYEDQIVSLFCNHCKLTFKAKPTYRKRFNHTLINHTCSGAKRKQYVLGVKRRKCMFNCNSYKGCIYRL